jgi:hypothetical protein
VQLIHHSLNDQRAGGNKQRSAQDSIGKRKKIAPNVDKLTSAGVALALICAC